jgi:hypothetical protein
MQRRLCGERANAANERGAQRKNKHQSSTAFFPHFASFVVQYISDLSFSSARMSAATGSLATPAPADYKVCANSWPLIEKMSLWA